MALAVQSGDVQAKADQLAKLAEERAKHERKVSEITGELANSWKGSAGSAIQSALENYGTQAADVRTKESEIAHLVEVATGKYDQADGNAAGALAQSMEL